MLRFIRAASLKLLNYAVIEFKSEPDQLKELSRVLGLRPFVVRQLTIAVGE